MMSINHKKIATLCAACGSAITACAASAQTQPSYTDLANYYVGVDTAEVVQFGTYSGLDNPNRNRLTFLRNHVNLTTPESSHYHSIGRYDYTGSEADGDLTVVPTNRNNTLPESYTGTNLELAPAPAGSPMAGKLVSGIPGSGSAFDAYGDLEVRITDTIPLVEGFAEPGGLGEAAFFLFNASNQSYIEPVLGLDIEMELVGVTDGLAVAGEDGGVLMSEVGDRVDLFDGYDGFTPTFFADADAAPGEYVASFRLHDESGTYLPSGTFNFAFTVVPEPASVALLGLGGLGLIRRR